VLSLKRIALSRVGARKGIRSMEMNKTHIISCHFDNWEPPTLPLCGKNGVTLYGLYSRDALNVDGDDG